MALMYSFASTSFVSRSSRCTLLSCPSINSSRPNACLSFSKVCCRSRASSSVWQVLLLSHYSCTPCCIKNSGSKGKYVVVCKNTSSDSAAPSALADIADEKDAQPLVDKLLTLVAGTDRGAALEKEDHRKVSELVSQLERVCIPEPLKSPLIFGDWNVEYSSNPTASGGWYRSTIGRFVLRTKEMVQTIAPPDIVGNKVSFALFGLVDGEVSLAGKLRALDNKWIEVTFDSPSFRLGPIQFQYGGKSQVKIAIIYLDERIRLGRGFRGSLFVFRRS